MKILGLIPARGGSKGIPRKNVYPFCGRPLIAWTIEAARQSKMLDRMIVSTDDKEIAEVSRQWGAEVPFMRPAELAGDESSGHDACEHALRWMEEHMKQRFDFLCALQPTSPLRLSSDIDAALKILEERKAPAVISVCRAPEHPFRARKIESDGTLSELFPTVELSAARQSFPPAYIINGAIYVASREAVLDQHTFLPPGTQAYIMPPERSLDIDTPWDLHLAELVLRDHATRSHA